MLVQKQDKNFIVSHTEKQQPEQKVIQLKPIERIVSEFTHLHEPMSEDSIFDSSEFIQTFRRNKISFRPTCEYEQFSFQVQRTFPSFDYYKLKVSIAHFSLIVSVTMLPQSNKMDADICGNFGTINFIQLGEQIICLKSFRYKTHSEFQKIFPEVVKEWTILKICSALECAPFIPNILGFDILIFDNCIQYATEKGEGIAKLTEQGAAYLKKELRLMHSFKIMHIDIKPENIVFSTHFGKPVFIDFGFSDIIREQKGFKSLTVFKGTPNYCTRQMLAIMLEQKGFIDLYYNDECSLKQTLKANKADNLLISFEEEDRKNIFVRLQDILSASKRSYATYAFQYYYIQSNEFKARQALQLSLRHNKNNAKKVLAFIKATARFVFIREIFENDLKSYESTAQYKEVEHYIRQNIANFFYKNGLNIYSQVDEESTNKSNKFELLSFQSSPQLTQSFQHYLNILLNLNEIDSNQVMNFVAITFQCIRFDVRNLEVSEKKQIADKMNPILLTHLQRDLTEFTIEQADIGQLKFDGQRESLKHIKLLLILIFQVCLTNKGLQIKWIKKHIFDVCQQIILIDICFLQFIDKIVRYVGNNFIQAKEKVLAILEFSRLFDTLNNINTIHIEKLLATQNLLADIIVKSLNIFMQQSQPNQDLEMVKIRKILANFRQNIEYEIQSSFEKEEMRIAEVQDLHIRKHIILLLTKKKVGHYFDMTRPVQIFEIAEFMQRSSDLQSLDIVSFSILAIKIMKGLYNYVGVNAYRKYLGKVINCKTIYDSLLIEQKQFTSNFDNHNFVVNRIRVIIDKHKNHIQQQMLTKQTFYLILLIQKWKLPLDRELHQQLIRLYNLFSILPKDKVDKVKEMREYTVDQLVYSYLQILVLFFFFELSTHTQNQFIIKLLAAQEEYKKIASNQQDNQYHYKIYCGLNMYLYQLYYYLHLCNYQVCFDIFPKIQSILKYFALNSLLFEIIKLEIDLAVKYRNMEFIEKAVQNLYNMCVSINYKGFYLLPSTQTQTYVTIVTFHSSNPSLFYKLLNQLICFLQSHPVDQYIQTLFSVLETFLAFNPASGYAIHYSKFLDADGKSQVKSNPFLLIFYAYSLLNEDTKTQSKLLKIIALYCNILPSYARKKILQKFFEVYFKQFKDDQRKQRLLFSEKRNILQLLKQEQKQAKMSEILSLQTLCYRKN